MTINNKEVKMEEKKNCMSLKFISLSENEPFARSCIQAFCLSLNPTISELNDVKTSVSEAVTNCIVHAYADKEGFVTVEAETFGNSIHIKISDEGSGIEDVEKAVEPFFTTRPDDERSGMGFTVMNAFMDEVKVISVKGSGTVIEMIKRFSSGAGNSLCDNAADVAWGKDA